MLSYVAYQTDRSIYLCTVEDMQKANRAGMDKEAIQPGGILHFHLLYYFIIC